MPVVLLERLPLPSLTTYTCLSVLMFASAVLQVVWDNDVQHSTDGSTNEQQQQYNENMSINLTNESDGYFLDLSAALLQEPWSICILVNTAYCCLILFGKFIQKIVFGELRVSEKQQLKDRFWNFVFYKFIFIFGVMNVQTMEEVALWCAWFSLLGFISLMTQLCKDRCQYLCSSPATTKWTHTKVMILLIGIETACLLLVGVCIIVGLLFSGINTFAFMAADCILLVVKSLYVIVRYSIYLWDLRQEGIWENRAVYVYYSELIFELTVVSVDFLHHLHMLLWGNIFLSMASLVICMQLRFLFHEFQRRIKRHKNYLHVVSSMEAKFPMAPGEQLEGSNDDCAICWERLESARILPCGHLFHNSCLRSWLEQDTTCPTCRLSLADPTDGRNANEVVQPGQARDMPHLTDPPLQPNQQQLYNHFFQFDGSRYVSWLPSFSVEVTHTTLLGDRPITRPLAQNSQLDNMARQVREVFPDVPLTAILEDLQRTRSVQLTLENIIERTTGNNQVRPTLSNNLNNVIEHINPVNNSGDALSSFSNSPTSDVLLEQPQPHSSSQDLYDIPNPQSEYSTLNSGWNNMFDENLSDSSDLVEHPTTVNDNTINSDYELQNIEENANCLSGSRFSKSPSERELILKQRKQTLLEQAKKQYLTSQKNKLQNSLSSDESSCSNEIETAASGSISPPTITNDYQRSVEDNLSPESAELRNRRNLAYEAARRRLQNN